MTILSTLLEITVPVFLIIGAGFASVRSGFLPDSIVDALVAFTTRAAVPCLLFMAMYRLDLATSMNGWAMLSFFVTGTIVFIGAMLLSRRFWRRRPGESVVVGFSAFFPNAVMLGIPITERAFGGATLAALFGLIAFHSIYNYFVGFITMEAIRADGGSIAAGARRAMHASFRNPLMMSIVVGLAANLTGLPVHQMGVDALDMLGSAALPAALFSIGGVLTRYRLKAEAGEALMVSAFSLVVHPAIVWFMTASVFGLDTAQVQAAVLMSAMPTGINSYIFATLYDRAVGTAASSVLLGTVLSIGTITLWLAALGA